MSKLCVVGTGPGNYDLITPEAIKVLENSDIIMGYEKYIKLIRPAIKNKSLEAGPVTEELERAKKAIEYVLSGKTVSIISSGDSGIYGMAGIVIELVAAHNYDIDIEIIPGITALNSAGSLLGVPFMNDFCSISLSDRLTEERDIIKRIRAAAEGDFVTALYNPVSSKRTELIKKAREIMLEYRNMNTPVGIVRNAYRDGQEVHISTLDKFLDIKMDMVTIVIIGNSMTYRYGKYMITPRNYGNKYEL
ncbi:MAG: precorrin-3B C(17)-methyltransferase [Ferroplasma sp.]|uniref:precorrin-3B C(17)-methyltransferase n=1 Tax=Ferroplasma sp. TaxID=2591003 RepID=UPI0028160AEF|nr:precorrin-3B C(17)-methyltransferase [Ferroplasma sp.]WMT50821.1 MAG: precorrin-3B C(17)-methyltransferase [Ferroplasma sp.]